ncbi:potassium/proton antiporter [Emticicia sp. CRIBPO]|uniref:potassium/proton antiporter n=1 Tax=Emticicia sp. CRIBPO TaxID=2683258 RepID=UPI0014133DDE|nr:potassium/proton antiporter [Emticicia sp. CRIBPO]NBA88237.1 potassium/proton antiporter [Emticicia sp. CRIBPO]
MHLTIENILLIGSTLLIISILAGKTSYKFGVPTLIFFLLVGMLAGSEGIGRIPFDDPKLAQFIGLLAFSFILFSGGLETDWKSTRPILWQGVALSTAGILLTAGSVAAFVWYLTDFTIYESLLLGSIVSSTDVAAVFSILRAKSVSLKHNLRPTLELESGSNDAMANVLTVVFTGLVVNQDQNLTDTIPFFLKQILIGGAMGFLLGKASRWMINKIKLDFEGLYPVLVIGLMIFTFSATDFAGGNGFLSIYICGVYLGNHDLIHKKAIIKAFDGFVWLMQIVLFLTLGLLVFPSQMIPVIGIGLLISAFLIFVARPLAVFISLAGFDIQNRSKWFISWVGLRGAVPIVFATYPLVAGIDKANMIFHIVFFISLTSVLIQGTTLPLVARWLHVSLPDKVKPKTNTDIQLTESVKSEMTEIILPLNASVSGKQIIDLGLPKTVSIAYVKRDGKYITPGGSTTLQGNDKLLILSENKDTLSKVYESLELV